MIACSHAKTRALLLVDMCTTFRAGKRLSDSASNTRFAPGDARAKEEADGEPVQKRLPSSFPSQDAGRSDIDPLECHLQCVLIRGD